MAPREGFSFPCWQILVRDTADALVSTGPSELGFHPGQVPEARIAFPQWKKLLFVCLHLVLLLTPE